MNKKNDLKVLIGTHKNAPNFTSPLITGFIRCFFSSNTMTPRVWLPLSLWHANPAQKHWYRCWPVGEERPREQCLGILRRESRACCWTCTPWCKEFCLLKGRGNLPVVVWVAFSRDVSKNHIIKIAAEQKAAIPKAALNTSNKRQRWDHLPKGQLYPQMCTYLSPHPQRTNEWKVWEPMPTYL